MNTPGTQDRQQNFQDGIRWDVTDAVGRIVLDQPEHHNTLDRKSAPALAHAIEEVTAALPRVIVIEACGPIFCAGGNIPQLAEEQHRLNAFVDEVLGVLLQAYLKLTQAPCPVVTMMGGAGPGLALCGNFVLASDSVKLRTGYAALGLAPDVVGASYFFARRAGAVRAQQWLMPSDTIDAARCLAAGGAVDQVLPAADLDAAAGAGTTVASVGANLIGRDETALARGALAVAAVLSRSGVSTALCVRGSRRRARRHLGLPVQMHAPVPGALSPVNP